MTVAAPTTRLTPPAVVGARGPRTAAGRGAETSPSTTGCVTGSLPMSTPPYGGLAWPAVVVFVNTVLSLFYYLRWMAGAGPGVGQGQPWSGTTERSPAVERLITLIVPSVSSTTAASDAKSPDPFARTA